MLTRQRRERLNLLHHSLQRLYWVESNWKSMVVVPDGLDNVSHQATAERISAFAQRLP
jgi:hypothetical protein